MPRIAIAPFLACLLLHLGTFAQKATPSIEQIADRFYNTYENDASSSYLRFEKRAGQWRVNEKKFVGANLVTVGNYLFFDVDSGGYQKLPFPVRTDTPRVDFRQHLDDHDLSNFHAHEYYGYDGWYKDVIATLSGKDHLSDSSLNSLARAYSTYASCLLTNQSGDAITGDLFDLPMTRNCMTAAQREKYHEVESKAILTFLRLSRQNPNFETIVGKIPIKYANEVMVEFHTYLTYADIFASTYTLPDHLYPDTVTDKARRILEKCPENAILLSLGDNDFYPVLYAQHKLGVRKDVHLINKSLIALDRYIYMATQPQFQSKPVQLSARYEHYKGNTNDYIFLEDRSTAMTPAQVIDTLTKGHRNDYNALTLPGKEFIIKHTPQNTTTIDKETIRLRLTAGYILKDDWIFLDMLNNLHGRRIACETGLYGTLAPLNQYFVQKDNDLFVY